MEGERATLSFFKIVASLFASFFTKLRGSGGGGGLGSGKGTRFDPFDGFVLWQWNTQKA